MNKYQNLTDLQWGVDDRRVRFDENSFVDIGGIGLKFLAILLALAVFLPARVAELCTALWPLPSFISWCSEKFQASPAKVSGDPVVVIGWMEGMQLLLYVTKI